MKRGPYKLRDKSIYNRELELRAQGFDYRYIGKEIGISHDTVKNWGIHIELSPGIAHQNYSYRIAAKVTDNLKSGIAIRQCLIRKRGRTCEKCQLENWLGKPITLEVNHIDGDNKNNVESNLARNVSVIFRQFSIF